MIRRGAATENHRRRPAVPDPAVETEVKLLLRACGFEIKDVPQNELVGFVGRKLTS